NDEHIAGLVSKIKSFAPENFSHSAAPLTFPAAPAPDPEAAARGKLVWQKLDCASCHGQGGEAVGGLETGNYDLSAQALRRPHALGEDAGAPIYQSLVTGVGTMESYAGKASSAQLWDLAAYVDGLVQ